jgi:hypothetical protein
MALWEALVRAHRKALPNGHKNGFSSRALEELESFLCWEPEHQKRDFYRLLLHFSNTSFGINTRETVLPNQLQNGSDSYRDAKIVIEARAETVFRGTGALPKGAIVKKNSFSF